MGNNSKETIDCRFDQDSVAWLAFLESNKVNNPKTDHEDDWLWALEIFIDGWNAGCDNEN